MVVRNHLVRRNSKANYSARFTLSKKLLLKRLNMRVLSMLGRDKQL